MVAFDSNSYFFEYPHLHHFLPFMLLVRYKLHACFTRFQNRREHMSVLKSLYTWNVKL